MGLRQLQLALSNLGEDFPTLAEHTKPGLACLNTALDKITDEAWSLLSDAQEKLQAEPVPVRPLQLLLSRIDTFRSLEALVDRPDRSRSSLLDRIENLRLRLEQARATRDRLARGAEEALAKGHWTTGLFDMERAATQLSDDSTDGGEARILKERLVQARRRKQEIEAAQQHNVELNNRYAQLQDDLNSTAAERLRVLQDRLHCLQFLELHAQKDRGSLYARDLRDVEVMIAQEHAGQAEALLDRTEDPEERLRIAQHALAQLDSARNETMSEADALPGRLQRLVEHWQLRLSAARRELDRCRAEIRAQNRRKLFYGASTFAVLTLASYVMIPWPSAAASDNHPQVKRLHDQADLLPTGLQMEAEQILFLVAATRTSTALDPMDWLYQFEEAQTALLKAMQNSPEASAAAQLSAGAWQVALQTLRGLPAWSTEPEKLEAAAHAARLRLLAAGMPLNR